MTSSDFNSHTNQLFIDLKLLKVNEIISSQQLKLISYPQILMTYFVLILEFTSTQLEVPTENNYAYRWSVQQIMELNR